MILLYKKRDSKALQWAGHAGRQKVLLDNRERTMVWRGCWRVWRRVPTFPGRQHVRWHPCRLQSAVKTRVPSALGEVKEHRGRRVPSRRGRGAFAAQAHHLAIRQVVSVPVAHVEHTSCVA